MRVTIKQIADIAGVHRSTVDKVIHNRKGVSDDVRERIQQIIDELGYKPNVIGKALARQNNPLKIAVILLRVDAMEYLKQGAKKSEKEYAGYGLEVEYYYTSSRDELEQLSILRYLEDRGLDGIIIHPLNNTSVMEEVNKLVDKGIPIVAVNMDITGSKRLCYIGENSLQAGRVAAVLMNMVLDKQGKVAVITSSDSLLNTKERKDSFEEYIRNNAPEIEISQIIEVFEDPALTFKASMDVLKTEPELDGIYITCGNVGEIGNAIKLSGLEKKVKVISYDIYPEIINLINEDIINFTISQNLIDQGALAVKVLFDLLFYHEGPKEEYIYTNTEIIVKENIPE